MEVPYKAMGKKAKRPTAGSWKSFLENLSARFYLESCQTIAEFNYIGFLEFSESQRLTKDQCEAQWNEAIDRLMSSSHKGLQKKALSLKKQWKNKSHSDDADVFWSKVKRKRGLDKGTLEVQAAVDSLWNKRVREEVEREMNDIADVTNKASAGSGTVLLMSRQKNRSVERTNFPPAGATASPSAANKDYESEKVIDDLNVMDVVTDEEYVGNKEGVGDEDNVGEALNEDDDESIEDLVQELEELIQKSEPGFHPLIKALYHAVRGEPFQKPQDRPDISESQAFLHNFVWERLDKFSILGLMEQKDTFVAISGIVDLDVHQNFPNRDERILECKNVSPQHEGLELIEKYKKNFVINDGDDVLEADLTELKMELERDLSKFRDGSDEKMAIEIILVLVKLSLPDTFKRPKATETSTLFVWHSIWQAIFSQTAVSVQVGETILKEARVDQLLVRNIVGPGASKGAKGVSGRRLDFRLMACVQKALESISVTLCNNEHKAPFVSHRAADLQHRKNTRLNKSILTRGAIPPGVATLFCDVVGLEGRMYTLKPFMDVWLSCEVNEPIKLPTNSFEMGTFLYSNQLYSLLSYRRFILSLARRCQGFASKPPPKTPTHSPRLLPTFYTPTSQRTKDVLKKQGWNPEQTDRHST